MIRRMIMVAFVVLATGIVQAGAQSDTPVRGPENAPLQIEAFLDFESEASARLSVVLRALSDSEPSKVRITFRHLPASDARTDVPPAHLAAVAAAVQGRFWDMAGLLFANQDQHTPADLSAMARQLGLDERRFDADLNTPSSLAVIAADIALAKEHGVTIAPAIVANGRVLTGARTLDELRASIPH